jgi:RNA polymerase sigma-70 factor, ECF subfamily
LAFLPGVTLRRLSLFVRWTQEHLTRPSLLTGLRVQAISALGDEHDAEDVVQETLVRAVEAIRGCRIPSTVPLAAFVCGIERHVIVDMRRARARERQLPNADQVPDLPRCPLETLIRAEERDCVHRAIRHLPDTDRELLRRCYVNAERIVDIARGCGEPPTRLRQRKSRALTRLREVMA